MLDLFAGLIDPKLPFWDQRCNAIGFKGSNAVGIVCRKVNLDFPFLFPLINSVHKF